jgi:hypothetical protein
MFKLFGSMFAIVFLLLVLVSGWNPFASVKDTSGNDVMVALSQRYIKDYERARDVKRNAERSARDAKRNAERWKAIKESLKALIPQRRAKPDGICRPEGSGSHRIVGMSGQIDTGPASTCAERRK